MKVVATVTESATPIPLTDIKEKPKPIPDVKPIDPTLVELGVSLPPELSIPTFPIDDSALVLPIHPEDLGAVAAAQGTVLAIPDTPLRYQAVRSSDDFYPPQAIRMAREGAAIVRACVDAGGRLSGTPSVVRTSRVSSLDAAAIRWASEALRFQPATRGGVAIEACKEFRVSFTLH
jgi:TonB family protein